MAERIEEALARIDDFEAVQRGAGPEGLADAVLCLQASVGIDDEARLAFREGLESRIVQGRRGRSSWAWWWGSWRPTWGR